MSACTKCRNSQLNCYAYGKKCSKYSINVEINNKIALKRGGFKYDIHDTIIALGTGSLNLPNMRFLSIYLSIYLFIYLSICIYKICIIFVIYEIYDIYLYIMWHCWYRYTRYIIYIYGTDIYMVFNAEQICISFEICCIILNLFLLTCEYIYNVTYNSFM